MKETNNVKTFLVALTIVTMINTAYAVGMNNVLDIANVSNKVQVSAMEPIMYIVTYGYTGTSYTVHVRCTTGADKGCYKVYLHDGDKYIKFCNSWIKIGNGRFSYKGNSYVFTYC